MKTEAQTNKVRRAPKRLERLPISKLPKGDMLEKAMVYKAITLPRLS